MSSNTYKGPALSIERIKRIQFKIKKKSINLSSSRNEKNVLIQSIKNKGITPFNKIKKLTPPSFRRKKYNIPQSSRISKIISRNLIQNQNDIYKIYEPQITSYKTILQVFNNKTIHKNKTLDYLTLRSKEINPCPLKNAFINSNINNNVKNIENEKTGLKKEVYSLKKIRKLTIKNLYEKNIFHKNSCREIKLKNQKMGYNLNFDNIKTKSICHNKVKIKTFLDLNKYNKKINFNNN